MTTLDKVQAMIRNRLATEQTLVCQGELLCGIELLPEAYREKDFRPLWIDADFSLVSAHALVDAIENADANGLNPADYHLPAIQEMLAAIVEDRLSTDERIANRWADLDLILTDAFLLYGSHLAAGRVNPETLHPDWKVDAGPVGLLDALKRAVAGGDIATGLESLAPAFDGYRRLRMALTRLRALALAGGWPEVPAAETLRPDDQKPAVASLRRRLVVSGDMDAAETVVDDTVFDAALVEAVKRFQQRHGLAVDGVVGRATYGMLNTPVAERIQQVMLNLERWRWLPRNLGERHLLINIADFNLTAVENDRVALQMRVVVGRPARRSPVFSARMSYLVVNPYWNVPTKIATEDILPEVQKDVTYLTQRGIRVFESWRSDAREIDPATIDWRSYNVDRFPFRLRQDPGPYNALGRIKFMFPNAFAVYLHDTPNRSLFRRAQRDFSSGCIRVEAPIELAAFTLNGDDAWPRERIVEQVENDENKVIRLSRPLMVHLLYMTAWVDESGRIQYRQDIYARDHDLQQAFNQRRPSPTPGFVSQPATLSLPSDT